MGFFQPKNREDPDHALLGMMLGMMSNDPEMLGELTVGVE